MQVNTDWLLSFLPHTYVYYTPLYVYQNISKQGINCLFLFFFCWSHYLFSLRKPRFSSHDWNMESHQNIIEHPKICQRKSTYSIYCLLFLYRGFTSWFFFFFFFFDRGEQNFQIHSSQIKKVFFFEMGFFSVSFFFSICFIFSLALLCAML